MNSIFDTYTLHSTCTSKSIKTMAIYNTCSRHIRRSRRPRTLSWYSEDSDEGHPKSLDDELEDITSSLDTLEDNINSQQLTLARDVQYHVKHIYDGVINDIQGIREKVNSIGDLVSTSKTFKQWEPSLASYRTTYQTNFEKKLKLSRSLDDLECKHALQQLKHLTFTRRIGSSHSLASRPSKYRTGKKVHCYGCCFNGDNKLYAFRTHSSTYLRKEECIRDLTESCSSTRGTGSFDELDDECSSCMRGDISNDWRIKVTPYLWDGWDTPGLDKGDIAKYGDRIAKLCEFRNDLLDVQNIHRYRHGCPELILSNLLTRDSQEWASRLALMGYAQYSELSDRGENILVVDIEYELTGRQVADTWYREGRFFDYNICRWQKGSSNFSQMIWKSSKLVGIGIAKFPGRNTYVIVVQYFPAGNTNSSGDFQENVPPVHHFESSV